jgi:hypothetical protein
MITVLVDHPWRLTARLKEQDQRMADQPYYLRIVGLALHIRHLLDGLRSELKSNKKNLDHQVLSGYGHVRRT